MLHARQQQDARPSSRYALEKRVGHIVVDSFDEIDRLERIAPGQKVMLRVTPGIKPDTHAYIQTGQVDSKFGFALDDVPRAIERDEAPLAARAARAHRLADLRPRAFEKLAEVLSAMGDYPLLNLGGGLAIAYTADEQPPSVEELRGRAARGRARQRDGALRARPLAGRATRA